MVRVNLTISNVVRDDDDDDDKDEDKNPLGNDGDWEDDGEEAPPGQEDGQPGTPPRN